MIAVEIIDQVVAAGCQIAVDGTDLALTATRPLLPELLAAIKAHKPEILAALAADTLPGVSPEFAARLSTDDLNDIAAGDIPLVTVQAYEEAAITREAEDLREHFEERAGILEYDGGMPRPEAELEAARITATYARNRGDLWDSLRTALVDYPALLTVLPAAPGAVDTLPPKGWLRSPCSRAGLYGGKERSPERRR